MNNQKPKKTQQETVGFVLIVVIVMIVGVIFLGISLRNKQEPVFVEDSELGNFLASSLKYTSDCYESHDSDFKSIEELTSYCYAQKALVCPNSKTPCKVLEDTYSDMLELYRPAGILKYSVLSFSYNDSLTKVEFLNMSLGNQSLCSSKRQAKQEIDKGTGRIIVQLQVCL
jgi:hypothetical protein